MRIAVWHNLPSGGAKRALHAQVRDLAARGHDVECWTPVTSDRTFLPLAGTVPVHVVDYRPPLSALNRLLPRCVDLAQKAVCLVGALRAISRQCAREIDAGGFDVLYAANCRYQAAPPIGRDLALPGVLYAQEPFRRLYEDLDAATTPEDTDGCHNARRSPSRPLLRRCTRTREERANARAFRRILVNSRYSASRIAAIYGVEPEVCYLGVDTDRFRNTGEPRTDTLVGMGSFQPHKRIDLALRWVARLPEPRPALAWVGNLTSADYLRYVRDLAASLDVRFEPRVRVTDDELVSALSRARALLYTSRMEPFGLAPLEAGACGAPVVAVDEGGVRETVRDGITGFLVPPDPDVAAERIGRLLADEATAARMGRDARAHVEAEWSQTKSTDRLEAILAEAAGV